MCHDLVEKAPLKALILKLMLMKNAPKSPLIDPMITAPRRTKVGVTTSGYALANFNALSLQSTALPCKRLSKNPIVNTAVQHVKKVFQSNVKVQTGFPLESSYKNNAPPIGAPKATLTPAEAPAAISYLLLTLFLINSYPGRLTVAEPMLAPI